MQSVVIGVSIIVKQFKKLA